MSLPTAEIVKDLRAKFFAKLSELKKSPETFHPKDMERVNNEERWLERFWEHNDIYTNYDERMSASVTMLVETCEWRMQIGANDINDDNVNVNYLTEGVFFVHSHDIHGCPLFIFRGKKHRKGQADADVVKRSVVYWFERVEREQPNKQVSLVFDMDGAGLGNLDMEFTKFLIGLFKQYYPNLLNFILIYEMPWVLNAAFKVIKSWLPAKAVEKITFMNKSTVKNYIAPEQALKSWGGLDEYVFSFVPMNMPKVGDESSLKKSVHFDDSSALGDTGTSPEKDDKCVKIMSGDSIVFDGKTNDNVKGAIIVKNVSLFTISFKVKTTAPEKFRVRPNSGCLLPNKDVTVHVKLQNGYQLAPGKDKFLVQAVHLDKPDLTEAEIAELWRAPNTLTTPHEQHRLNCISAEAQKAALNSSAVDGILKNGSVVSHHSTNASFSSGSSSSSGFGKTHMDELFNALKALENKQDILRKECRRMQFIQMFLIFIVLAFALACYYFSSNLKDVYCYTTSSRRR